MFWSKPKKTTTEFFVAEFRPAKDITAYEHAMLHRLIVGNSSPITLVYIRVDDWERVRKDLDGADRHLVFVDKVEMEDPFERWSR